MILLNVVDWGVGLDPSTTLAVLQWSQKWKRLWCRMKTTIAGAHAAIKVVTVITAVLRVHAAVQDSTILLNVVDWGVGLDPPTTLAVLQWSQKWKRLSCRMKTRIAGAHAAIKVVSVITVVLRVHVAV